ncbi:hypothetical protein [Campylobacter upsaliensis]|uniref:hypothetical protein n=1 Tax=Campylobacter upsaliensis TaxID=28080 RepID=UPI002149A197|nr:hypothetical protein [Campylobacter upsaliensis]MCR2101570.1 hypothetical protein [Campylobacter upsaliensis]
MKNKLTRILDNLEKLAGSFSLTLIAMISYLFLNAENLFFLRISILIFAICLNLISLLCIICLYLKFFKKLKD